MCVCRSSTELKWMGRSWCHCAWMYRRAEEASAWQSMVLSSVWSWDKWCSCHIRSLLSFSKSWKFFGPRKRWTALKEWLLLWKSTQPVHRFLGNQWRWIFFLLWRSICDNLLTAGLGVRYMMYRPGDSGGPIHHRSGKNYYYSMIIWNQIASSLSS